MAELNLEIITHEQPIFTESVDSITLPGTLGNFQVLKNHAPLISTLEIGIVKVKKDNGETFFTTSGGTVEVNDNKVLVLADSIEKVDSIDIDRAQDAKRRAEERIKRKHEEDIEEVRAETALKRAINRISAKEKYI